mmetsp:Transcript_45356/g.60213  ORF Transcript_45356/g.60213 Transcript_45356/m.60213 type:complete len:127 (+) Transcript_45356:29-409(+)|eukprot:CAMPEP_0185582670 /NCGR_PEP_ID=MMETSP0434-20130131/21046_1 /TAXON_ID=626734 ORGANISM="Favella taraikaensis, Strain Fe Narragansett Bay" /NCGR_SAMPLE_ID=MMETSP0434 /ASSEMBLY_ACC=CAM_ASM_000379 /LENGTH=126 /DNA_ID=CAMNT_0028201553 /DNA_START=29 /DNA_END=409 /DNA_ORIENTATION=+
MVVKTDLCSFSEHRIYPGHGSRWVRRDGGIAILISSKCKSLTVQRKKPSKITWTQAWRRLNKKTNVESGARKTKRRTARVQRSIVGASVEDIKAKRALATKKSSAAATAAKKEAAARAAKKKGGRR